MVATSCRPERMDVATVRCSFFRTGPDGKDRLIPTIRVEMLRDGVEAREYFHLLKQRLARRPKGANDAAGREWIDRARELVTVPDTLVRSQYEMSGDVQLLLARRAQMAAAIEALVSEK